MRRGTQARQLGTLRLACLEARRQEAAAMVGLLRHPSAAAVKKSADAVLGLPGVSGCAEAEALSAPVPPPDDGPMRQRLNELTARLAHVSAEDATSDPRTGPDAEALAAEVDQAGFAPLQAATYLILGTFYERTGNAPGARTAYFRSLVAAERGRAEVVRARVAARLAYELGHYFSQYEEADRWLDVSTAITDRTPMYDVEVFALHIMAQVRLEEGRMTEALAALDRMDALLAKRARADDPSRVYYYSHRSDAFYELGRIEESVRFAREALAFSVDLYGEKHPVPARLHYLLARVLVEAGQASEARAHLDAAVRYWSATDTPNPLYMLDAGDIRATSYQVEGRYQEALDEARRVLAQREKTFGKEQADFSFSLDNIGMALIGLGRSPEAIPPLERSLALKTAAGMGMISSAEGMLALARALWDGGGDRRRARKLAADAEQATRLAPLGRVHREAADWLKAHP